MKRVLVTGASGFVGGHLALGLAGLGFDVIAVGGSKEAVRANSPHLQSIAPVLLNDANGVARLLQQYTPDVIVHAAALADAARCQNNPELAEEINVQGTEQIVTYYKQQEALAAPLLLYISTDLVFEGREAPPAGITEEEVPLPRSVYAISKRRAELVVESYPGPASILRICLTYGPALALPWGTLQGFLGWMLGALQSNSPLRLFSDEWRTPVHVDQITQTVQKVIEHSQGASILPKLLHIAGDTRISRSDLGFLLAKTYGLDATCIETTTRDSVATVAPRAKDVSLSAAQAQKILGCNPWDITTGLTRVRESDLARAR